MDSKGCLTCGFSNPPGMGFCGSCGARLSNTCSACGFDNPPDFRYCGRCGAAVESSGTEVAPSSRSSLTEHGSLSIAPERRQISVLFCDLVGSTQLSHRLDPEDLREVVLGYQAVCARIIERYGGHIAQYLGDGLLVYFGYPTAHEDDARRAVHAGLEMMEGIEGLSERVAPRIGQPLSARVGIHTGDVVIGEVGGGGRSENLALGSTPNLAARLQGLAEPGTVLISAETEALVSGFFSVDALGPQELKGASRPHEVFRVQQESGVQNLFELSLYEGLTGLVGREAEIGLFKSNLERVREGQGRVILLTGEAGIGKSRLVHQMRQVAAGEEDLRWRVCRGSPFHQTRAFHPVIELLETVLRFEASDSAEDKLRKLEERVVLWEQEVDQVAPLFAELLSIPTGDRYPEPDPSPQKRKEALQTLLVELVAVVGRTAPSILVFEDLHWFDPSTLEVVRRLVEGASRARALMLLTARLDFQPPWELTSEQTRIVVDRLPADGVRAMVDDLAGGKELPQVVVQAIVDRTDGVPLFVEELTKTVLESDLLEEEEERFVLAEDSGHGSMLDSSELAIPSSLKDSLMARFDKVGDAKRTAQIASVLGRDFSFELLEALVEDRERLEEELAELVRGEFLFQRGVPPKASFLFKHALVQEATYGSLLKSDRRETHSRVASALQSEFPELAAGSPEVVAHHLEHGGEIEAAVPLWKSAGERSAQSWAHAEASSNFSHALGLLDTLDPTAERRQLELELRMALGIGQIVTRGYAADEVRDTYLRAQALSEEIGDTPLPVRYGIWAVHLMRGDLEVTAELARWFKGYAERPGGSIELMMANACVATWFFYRGQHEQALRYLERTMEHWRGDQHAAAAQAYGGCGGFYGHLFTSGTLWFLGRTDRALQQYKEVERIVEGLSAPYTETMSDFTGQMLFHLRQEPEAVRSSAGSLVARATELDFPLLVAMGECGLGWAEARLGDQEGGIERSQRGLTTLEATGTTVLYPYCASFLIETLGDAEREQEGLELAAKAIDISRTSLDSFFLPELLRLQGVLLGSGEGARASFDEALDLARQRGALSLELRTAVSLARLLSTQGGRREGRELVRGVLDRFEEGLESRDLLDANRFLSERAGIES